MGPQVVLDVRMSRRLLKGEQLLRIVDGVGPGEQMLIVSAEDPTPLLALISSQRPFAFDVQHQRAAGLFHARLSRRRRARPATLGECLRWEYRYLEVQLARIQALIAGGQWRRAGSAARSLRRAFARHTAVEDAATFPPSSA
ncbi:MAG: hypothetical protein ACK4N5_11620, partial [Myxococcales bacterium]